MPDDLRASILAAIAAAGDEDYRSLLALLMRVEEVFIERVERLTEQMAVPAQQHAEDHAFITELRANARGLRSAGWRLAYAVAEKLALVAAGAMAMRWLA